MSVLTVLGFWNFVIKKVCIIIVLKAGRWLACMYVGTYVRLSERMSERIIERCPAVGRPLAGIR